MRSSAQPVAVITTLLPQQRQQQQLANGEDPTAAYVHGATLSSFTTVSLDPSLVAFSIRTPSRLADALRRTIDESTRRPHFIVNILSSLQGNEASEFAKPGLSPLKLKKNWSEFDRLHHLGNAKHPLSKAHFFPSKIAKDDDGIPVPVLSDSLGSLACSIVSRLPLKELQLAADLGEREAEADVAGSELFIAEVHGVEYGREPVDDEQGKLPMVYWDQQFTTVIR
ncbi:hypothetical protein CBS101457_000628 [Exobasidium rhododendri]|nr:hypothetical protein CBS101457_000628 [Exobasidium rhododendri]